MTDEELETVLRLFNRRRPFRPYLLTFINGEKVLVDHPEFVGPIKNVWLCRGKGREQSLFARSSVCRVLDIVEAAVF